MRAIIGTAALWVTVVLLLTAPVNETHAAANSPRPAPVGHRQPTAQDVQGTQQGTQQDNSADQAMKKMDEDLDKKLKGICRGC
jgi:hypothetical protein